MKAVLFVTLFFSVSFVWPYFSFFCLASSFLLFPVFSTLLLYTKTGFASAADDKSVSTTCGDIIKRVWWGYFRRSTTKDDDGENAHNEHDPFAAVSAPENSHGSRRPHLVHQSTDAFTDQQISRQKKNCRHTTHTVSKTSRDGDGVLFLFVVTFAAIFVVIFCFFYFIYFCSIK